VIGKYTHIAVGNFNIDLVLYVDSIPGPDESTYAHQLDVRPGGAASNYAAAIAQYGHEAFLVASVAKHPLVGELLHHLESLGVKTRYVKYVEQQPGFVTVMVLPSGDRAMIRYPGANRELRCTDIPDELLDNANVLHIASVPVELAIEIATRGRKHPLLITYDPGGYVEEMPRNKKILEYINVLFLNEKEYERIKNEVNVHNVFKHGVSLMVIKQGAKGATLIEPSGVCYYARSHPVRKPIDTTGAGDVFNAFFNARYLERKDPAEALRYAVAAGTLKVGYKGSILPYDERQFKVILERTFVEKITCSL